MSDRMLCMLWIRAFLPPDGIPYCFFFIFLFCRAKSDEDKIVHTYGVNVQKTPGSLVCCTSHEQIYKLLNI